MFYISISQIFFFFLYINQISNDNQFLCIKKKIRCLLLRRIITLKIVKFSCLHVRSIRLFFSQIMFSTFPQTTSKFSVSGFITKCSVLYMQDYRHGATAPLTE